MTGSVSDASLVGIQQAWDRHRRMRAHRVPSGVLPLLMAVCASPAGVAHTVRWGRDNLYSVWIPV